MAGNSRYLPGPCEIKDNVGGDREDLQVPVVFIFLYFIEDTNKQGMCLQGFWQCMKEVQKDCPLCSLNWDQSPQSKKI